MEDNAYAYPLRDLGSLWVRGDEARQFLQSQLSSDLRQVSDTRGQLAGWHDPKGRVLAFLKVMPWSDGFLLVMHAGLLAAVEQRLRLYVLRAKVMIEKGPPLYGTYPEGLAGLFPRVSCQSDGAAQDSDSATASALTARVTSRCAALRLPGGWLVAGWLEPTEIMEDAAAVQAWEHAEVAAGLPEVYPETSGQFVAQMINLDRIGAVDFNKGCYPGQEIVARAHYLGRVKRRARVLYQSGPPPAPGAALTEPAGIVVRAVPHDGGALVMAVVTEPDAD